jgi:hypothetical protein
MQIMTPCSVTVALLMMCSAGGAQKQAALAPSEVIALAVAPNEKLTAVITDEPRMLWFIGTTARTKVAMALPAEMTQPRVSWSADSKYVAIQYQISDDESGVDVVDVTQPSPALIDAGRGHSARWSRTSHSLYIVPDFGAAELPKTPGLIVFDPSARTSETVATDYYFIGRYDVGESKLVAQGIRYVDGRPTYSLIAYDFKKGSVEILKPSAP